MSLWTLTSADKPTAASLEKVTRSKDSKSLEVTFSFGGKVRTQQIKFPAKVADFHFAKWFGDQGIAVAAKADDDSFYYAAFRFSEHSNAFEASHVPVAASKHILLGIAGTGGDSLVITAVEHRRDGVGNTYGPDRLQGWMFIDNCPHIGSMPGVGIVIPFDLKAPVVAPKP